MKDLSLSSKGKFADVDLDCSADTLVFRILSGPSFSAASYSFQGTSKVFVLRSMIVDDLSIHHGYIPLMRPPFKTATKIEDGMFDGGDMMSEKTWVYWIGLLIVAFSIVGLIRGFVALAMPMNWVPPMAHAARLVALATRLALVRLIGALIFLGVGVYMMKSGRVIKQ